MEFRVSLNYRAWDPGRPESRALHRDSLVGQQTALITPQRSGVVVEAVRWGKPGARVNTIRPGTIISSLARDELNGARGAEYRRMTELSAAGPAGTPDEIGKVGALLMGPDGRFTTDSDFLMDGGVTAAYWYGELAPQ